MLLKTLLKFFLIALCALLISCAQPKGTFLSDPGGTSSPTGPSYAGYIVVANSATRTVVLYDATFNEHTARVLKQYPASNTPTSLAKFDRDHVLVTVDGTPDRVDKINLTTGVTDTGFILDSTNLTGVIKGIARLSGGDIVVSDNSSGAHLERFSVASSSVVRYTVGWPATLLNTTFRIFPLSNNSFLACAGGTSDVVRTYNNVGVLIASASATTPAPSLGVAHDVTGCTSDSSGRIAVAYNGATDTIRLYDSTMTTTIWSYSNLAQLPNPLSLAVRPNGNLLAADANNQVVEINGSDGTFVASFQPQLISTVSQLMVFKDN